MALALAYAVGTGLGLRAGPVAVIVGATALAGFAVLRRRPPEAAAVCLPIGFLVAGLAGAAAAERVRRACPGTLRTGDRVVATGVVANLGASGVNRRSIVRLAPVRLAADGAECSIGTLVVRLDPREALPQAGARVTLHGTWRRRDDGRGWPVRPGRQGTLTGAAPAAAVGLAMPWRLALAVRLSGRLPEDVSPVGLAILLAERDDLNGDTRRTFTDAGIAHLLAISGMHVGMLAAGASWLLCWLPGRRRHLAALLLVTVYVVTIGAPVAARRALFVYAGFVRARWRGWPARPGELLGAACLGNLLMDPLSLSEPGFQLSFAGFAGVLVGARMTGSTTLGAPGTLRSLARGVLISSFALFATMPLTAWHFGQVTPVSVVSHLIAAPLVATSLGGLVAALALPDPLWVPAAAVATGSIRLLNQSAGILSHLPLAHLDTAAPGIVAWLAWGLAAAGLYRAVASGVVRSAARPVLMATSVLAAAPLAGLPAADHALLCTLSVGQGDAAVLRTRRGSWLVFDGGPAVRGWDAGRSVLIPFLRRQGAGRVDLALLSHPDLDHLGGLATLVEEFPVERVLDTGDAVPSGSYERFLANVDEAGSRWLPAAAGDRLQVGDVDIRVLGPIRFPGRAVHSNATSLAFLVAFEGGFRYLNTGDATAREESELLAAWPADSLRADLMKIGHHGSRTSSTVEFLEAARPSLAVISSGFGNPYGHPHAETLLRIDSARIPRVWRTDRDGTLCVEIDAHGNWRVQGEPGWRRVSVAPKVRGRPLIDGRTSSATGGTLQ